MAESLASRGEQSVIKIMDEQQTDCVQDCAEDFELHLEADREFIEGFWTQV